MKILKKIIRALLIFLLVLSTLALLCIAPIDDTPYQEQAYYEATLQALDSLEKTLAKEETDTVQAGWSEKNITPQKPVSLMGYGWKGDYERVHDSLQVRAVVFSNNVQSVAWLSYDLMVLHPDLVHAIRQAVDTAQLPVRNLYFTAVHTHNGFGEWAKGLGGKLIAGGYNEDLVKFIVEQTLRAIREAYADRQPVKVGYGEFAVPELINNRLVKGGEVDSYLRAIKLEQNSGITALLCTYAAHATFLNSKRMDLSADYPSALVEMLEKHAEIDFAAFAAGAVGSHSPLKEGEFSYEKMDSYATQLAKPLLQSLDSIPTYYTTQLRYADIPFHLGESQLKLSPHWRVRPWLFSAVMGNINPQITGIRLGDVMMVGTPADYSGMLYKQLHAEDIHLVVSSFNGSYIGYVIPDTYYDQEHREARELNWFGPFTGSYMTEVMNKFIRIVGDGP
ncbi:neutral/alkaline non-lysosomal ceramidase N-terminal domain-containing protein [Catalinimonas niigatensis]|uniref:neutral/alkaline non-lysosomal ceramidase N-terminal domain-containing protein n=1 Tax=Catalinimonas niigatensis TaxID=1397264 RepID=UPI002665E1B6|nr:neutral/alkaline non-lysosomal ceramidase N-terminal domain-containing protein [Catalinimonas niigatensis]WPP48807.1 neutral/alkaline non-lysosomal ceramidase N-terminal domain-containing protein [Catalinimonas niigatensis]